MTPVEVVPPLPVVNGPPPLFAYQYPQAWIDMRTLRDSDASGIDYFRNSVSATRAHRAYCLSMSPKFPRSYSENVWGITASDSASATTLAEVPARYGSTVTTASPASSARSRAPSNGRGRLV